MKKNVAIVMGGFSSEYEISMGSGQVVYESIDREKFNPYKVVIEKDRWYAQLDSGEEITIDKNDFGFELEGKKITFEAVFNVIHGTPGEDGKLPGYWDMLDIPYTSCAPFEAALTFNKRECVAVVRQYDIPTADSVFLSKGAAYETAKIVQKLGLPCFVKPNRAGSSFGVSKVKKEEDLHDAIENAFAEDSQILVESFLDGIEVSVGTMRRDGEVFVFPITEIRTDNEFFDFQAKYEGASDEITPAEISEEVAKKVQVLASKVYSSLNIKGLVRTDFIIVNDEPHFLEVNTIPGMSRESILPKQARHIGMDLSTLFTMSIENCL